MPGPWIYGPDGIRNESHDLVCDAPSPIDCDHLTCNVGKPKVSPAVILQTLTSPEELRAYLDALNEGGQHPVATGVTSAGQPFLATLVGPYADSEHVLFDSPWADFMEGPVKCSDCNALVHGLEDVTFPAVVMTVVPRG